MPMSILQQLPSSVPWSLSCPIQLGHVLEGSGADPGTGCLYASSSCWLITARFNLVQRGRQPCQHCSCSIFSSLQLPTQSSRSVTLCSPNGMPASWRRLPLTFLLLNLNCEQQSPCPLTSEEPPPSSYAATWPGWEGETEEKCMCVPPHP